MDRKQFLEQLAAPAGGKENIGLCDFRSGCLSVTVKDRSVIDLNAIRGLPGVADAELLRSRLRITPDQTIMEELQMAKKEDYGALAKQILSLVGGAENVSNATHCATRLRFNLKDESKADTDAIKGLAGVVGVAQANGQYQVIIADEVTQVYEKLSGMLGTAPAAAAPAPKGKWYDHIVSVRNAEPKTEQAAETPADGAYTAAVVLEGGSGRATVDSPAALTVAEGKMTATIVWSSPNYDYMIVDGEKYLPTNTEGNSTFEIPVAALGTPLTVTADTVAMSKPHEIEYTLTFTLE